MFYSVFIDLNCCFCEIEITGAFPFVEEGFCVIFLFKNIVHDYILFYFKALSGTPPWVSNKQTNRFSSRGPGEFVFYAKNCTRVQKISEIEETFVNNWLVR